MSQKALDELNKIREEQAKKFGKTTRAIVLTVDQLIAIQIILQHALEGFCKPDDPPSEFDKVVASALAAVTERIERID
jgi:hypothetical protein